MSDYTPTTDDVREDFAFPWSPDQIGDRPARVAAFDRWLAEHDRQVAERAWDEGAEEAWNRSTPLVNGLHYQWRTAGEPLNPYRAAKGEQ